MSLPQREGELVKSLESKPKDDALWAEVLGFLAENPDSQNLWSAVYEQTYPFTYTVVFKLTGGKQLHSSIGIEDVIQGAYLIFAGALRNGLVKAKSYLQLKGLLAKCCVSEFQHRREYLHREKRDIRREQTVNPLNSEATSTLTYAGETTYETVPVMLEKIMQQFRETYPKKSRTVTFAKLLLEGKPASEVADSQNVSVRTVQREWDLFHAFAVKWLHGLDFESSKPRPTDESRLI